MDALSVIGLQAEADCEQNSASAVFIWTSSVPWDPPHSCAVLTQTSTLKQRDYLNTPLILTKTQLQLTACNLQLGTNSNRETEGLNQPCNHCTFLFLSSKSAYCQVL